MSVMKSPTVDDVVSLAESATSPAPEDDDEMEELTLDTLPIPAPFAYDNPLIGGSKLSLLSYDVPDKEHGSFRKQGNSDGNNVLHRAVKSGNIQVLQANRHLLFSDVNHKRETPLHLAVAKGDALLRQLLELIEQEQQTTEVIDKQDSDGNTALHRAVVGDVSQQTFTLLCRHGADLSAQNQYGDTALHCLVAAAVLTPDDVQAYIDKLNTVAASSLDWWVKRDDIINPRPGSASHASLTRYAFLQLSAAILNNDGLNALQFATQLGASAMLEAILHTRGAFYFEDSSSLYRPKMKRYDVTCLTPETAPQSNQRSPSRAGSVYPTEIPNMKAEDGLDIIARMENYDTALSVLDISPYKELVENYWRPYRIVYLLAAVPHVIYMCWYSYHHFTSVSGSPPNTTPDTLGTGANSSSVTSGISAINTTDNFSATASTTPHGVATVPSNSTTPMSCSFTTSQANATDRAVAYCYVLTWPLILLIFEMYYFAADRIFARRIRSRNRIIREGRSLEPRSPNVLKFDNIGVLLQAAGHYVFDNLPHLAAVLFIASICLDYCGYVFCGEYRLLYVLTAFIYGWMYATVFPRGFEGLHSFSILYKFIIVQDIPKVASVLAFVVLGYACCFYLMFLISGVDNPQFSGIDSSLFSTLQLMFTHDYSWGVEIEQFLVPFGVDIFIINTIFLSFMLITTIVFVNILIAMMTETYSRTNEQSERQWKINSLVRAIKREEKMPGLRKVLQRFKKPSHQLEFVELKVRGVRRADQKEILYPPMIRCMMEIQ